MQKLNTPASSIPALTKEQAVIISAYTGFTACNFGDLHEAVEKKLGRPLWMHQFGDEGHQAHLKAPISPLKHWVKG